MCLVADRIRRKVRRGLSPMQADNMHLHQLVYSRIAARERSRGEPRNHTEFNSLVAKYFWAAATAVALLGISLWQSTPTLIAATAAFCVLYVVGYRQVRRDR